MIEFKQNQSARVPVRLYDSVSGDPKGGVIFSDVTVTVEKSDGTVADLTVAAPDWNEPVGGAFSNSGKYTLSMPGSFLNLPGVLCYAVQADGATIYVGSVKVVANEKPYVTFLGGGETEQPIIISAVAPRRDQLRIIFSEDVVMTTASNGALNISNYAIEGITVVAVEQEAPNQVLLTTGVQTAGVLYNLTVSNIEDLNGNVIADS
jgi:hypothetical protein